MEIDGEREGSPPKQPRYGTSDEMSTPWTESAAVDTTHQKNDADEVMETHLPKDEDAQEEEKSSNKRKHQPLLHRVQTLETALDAQRKRHQKAMAAWSRSQACITPTKQLGYLEFLAETSKLTALQDHAVVAQTQNGHELHLQLRSSADSQGFLQKVRSEITAKQLPIYISAKLTPEQEVTKILPVLFFKALRRYAGPDKAKAQPRDSVAQETAGIGSGKGGKSKRGKGKQKGAKQTGNTSASEGGQVVASSSNSPSMLALGLDLRPGQVYTSWPEWPDDPFEIWCGQVPALRRVHFFPVSDEAGNYIGDAYKSTIQGMGDTDLWSAMAISLRAYPSGGCGPWVPVED